MVGGNKSVNSLNNLSATLDKVGRTAASQELTDAEHARLRAFSSNTDHLFAIETILFTRKRIYRASAGGAGKHLEKPIEVQEVCWYGQPKKSAQAQEERTECIYYTAVGDQSIAVGDYVLVKHDNTDDGKVDCAAQWKAKVFEVHALDSQHDYIRAAWFNRPEDLDTGRQSCYGKNELTSTSQLDIIDIMTVNSKLENQKWDEDNNDATLPGPEE